MMALKKQRGNMYEFVTHMWSPVKGHCSHHCSYCYMNQDRQPPLHLDEKDLGTNLGSGKFIFVCHTCDMFAEDVPHYWILQVLKQTLNSLENKYLFQTKNPKRMYEYCCYIKSDSVCGTTIETNRKTVKSFAPSARQRAKWLKKISEDFEYETMITIEPVFDFDLEPMAEIIISANPTWVNIGADSKGHHLPEPPVEKIRGLIEALKKHTNVKLKGNLKRIYPQESP